MPVAPGPTVFKTKPDWSAKILPLTVKCGSVDKPLHFLEGWFATLITTQLNRGIPNCIINPSSSSINHSQFPKCATIRAKDPSIPSYTSARGTQ